MSTADPRGKFVWHELLSADTASAGAFYPKVDFVEVTAVGARCVLHIDVGKNGPVGGVMGMPAEATAAPHWIAYVGVDIRTPRWRRPSRWAPRSRKT